ncbi:MAG: hypothetical protein KAU24_03185 [Candidatus Aenigmarchaeota archaeon]|nr:hypothetical protein [Candidatus Aenigmarchaeota archaeon]
MHRIVNLKNKKITNQLNVDTMTEHYYGVFKQASMINKEWKKKLASQEEPLYAQDVVQSLLNHLKTEDSRFFKRYDINLAVDGKGMRGDMKRFRQEMSKRKGKRNLFTYKGALDILDYHKGRLRKYEEGEIPEILKIIVGTI